MESAPLTLAWEHAKAASIATQTSDTSAALTSHAQAAGEFAKAALSTSHNEALRTLKLLENHHRQLGELLKFPRDRPVPPSTVTDKDITTKEETPVSTSAAVAELRAKSQNAAAQQQHKDGTSPSSRRAPNSTFPRRMPPREMSSSIASNLASARGIRSVSAAARALSPSITATDAPGTMGPPPRRRPVHTQQGQGSPKPTWLPPASAEAGVSTGSPRRRGSKDETASRIGRVESTSAAAGSPRDHAKEQPTTMAEDGFAKFYSAFESLKSKLSAPLAFAGLPLISEEETPTVPNSPAPASKSRFSGARRATTTGEPDLTKYFSKAAIKASLTTSQAAVNDSFYVVPTSGGTVSYAQMVGYDDTARNTGAEIEDDNEGDEDFVDAREHPVTPNAGRSFGSGFGRRSQEKEKSAEGKTGPVKRGGQAHVQEELLEKNRFLEQAVVEMREALERERRRLRVYQGQSQAGTLAVQNLMLEGGMRSTGSEIQMSIHQSMMKVAGNESLGTGWTEQPVMGIGRGAVDVDVDVLRREIMELRAEVGREKRARRKVEGEVVRERGEREREAVEREVLVKGLRDQIEGFRGDAVKYRQLERSAREKAERRKKEARSERSGGAGGGGSERGAAGGREGEREREREREPKPGSENGSRANDAARFVSG